MSGSIEPDSGHFLLDLPFFFGAEPDTSLIRLELLVFTEGQLGILPPIRLVLFFI